MNDTQETQARIDQLVKSSEVVLFMKGTAQFPMCGFSGRAIQVALWRVDSASGNNSASLLRRRM